MLSPGDYLRLRREAAGVTIEALAACVSTAPALMLADRAAWLRAIEDGIAPVSVGTALALRHHYPFDLDVLDHLTIAAAGFPAGAPPLCHACGGWRATDTTLCRACSERLQTRPGTIPPVGLTGAPA